MTIEERISALEKRVTILEGDQAQPQTTQKKATSLREFINQIHPGTANDTALVIAYFAEIINGQGYFTNDTIRDGYVESKMIPPKNISDVIAKNAKKGYLMLAKNADTFGKAYILTNTGEEYIKEMIDARD